MQVENIFFVIADVGNSKVLIIVIMLKTIFTFHILFVKIIFNMILNIQKYIN